MGPKCVSGEAGSLYIRGYKTFLLSIALKVYMDICAQKAMSVVSGIDITSFELTLNSITLKICLQHFALHSRGMVIIDMLDKQMKWGKMLKIARFHCPKIIIIYPVVRDMSVPSVLVTFQGPGCWCHPAQVLLSQVGGLCS